MYITSCLAKLFLFFPVTQKRTYIVLSPMQHQALVRERLEEVIFESNQGHPTKAFMQNTLKNAVFSVLRSFCDLLKAYLCKLSQFNLFGC